jgi:uncharacterized membrane protein YfhO
MPVIFPFLRKSLWLFTGEYYRGYSLMVMFFVLYYALQALHNILETRKVSWVVLTITASVLFGLLFFPLFIDKNIVDHEIRSFVAGMLAVYVLLLFVIGASAKNTFLNSRFKYVKYLLFLVIVAELCIIEAKTANRRDAFNLAWVQSAKVIYNDYCLDATRYLQKTDHSFYRVDRNFFPASARFTALDNGQVQGYNGTTSYSSFNQLYYIKYLQLTGAIDEKSEPESRWAIGTFENPILECENHVKYFYGLNKYHPEWHEMWDSIAVTGEATIFRNKYVLPFGYTYDHYITESDFRSASPTQRKFITLRAMVVKDKEVAKYLRLTRFNLSDTTKCELTFETFSTEINADQKDSLSISQFQDTRISGSITVKGDRLLYLSVPFDDGWHLLVDYKETKKLVVDGGMTGVMLSAGTHTIEMKYKLTYLNTGLLMSLAGIIIIALNGWYRRKKNNNINLSLS